MGLSQEIKRQVFERDGFKCAKCGLEIDPVMADIHHVIPISKGGTNELSNLITLCKKCNYSITDKLIDVATTPLSKTLAETWVDFYKKAPEITSTLTLLITVIVIVVGTYNNYIQQAKQEAERKENLTYYNQIKRLDETEKNIQQLLNFVNEQRTSLKATRDSIESLKTEKQKLEPIVESNRQVVEALFIAQEERNHTKISRERWLGFGLGILASIIASTILIVLKYFINREKST